MMLVPNIGFYCRLVLQWREARVATALDLHIAPDFVYEFSFIPLIGAVCRFEDYSQDLIFSQCPLLI